MTRRSDLTLLLIGMFAFGLSHPYRLRAQASDTTGLGPLRMLDSLRKANSQEYELFRSIFVVGAQMGLGRLGFGPVGYSGVIDSGTASAVRQFERARGLPITGDLFNRATFRQLNTDLDVVTKSEQRPDLGFKQFAWSGDWVIAEGPWYSEGEPETYMVAHVYCDRVHSECRLAWARLGPGVLTSRALQVLTETFQVNRWDQAEVMSEPLDYPCARYVLRINRVQETVVMTRSTLSRTGTCSFMEVRDFVTRLIRPEDWPPGASSRSHANPFDLYNIGPAARAAFSPKPR